VRRKRRNVQPLPENAAVAEKFNEKRNYSIVPRNRFLLFTTKSAQNITQGFFIHRFWVIILKEKF